MVRELSAGGDGGAEGRYALGRVNHHVVHVPLAVVGHQGKDVVEVRAHAAGVKVQGRFVGFFMGFAVHEDYYYDVVADVALSLQLLCVNVRV